MTRNEGRADRIVRVVLGAALGLAGVLLVTGDSLGTGAAAGAVGLLLLVTGAVGFCPAYRLIGLSTCPARV
jgi:hypothetical protein